MLSRILVPMDGSELAERALAYALENYPDASVTVLTVVGEPSVMMGRSMGLAMETNFDDAAAKRAELIFSRARDIADEHDAEIETAVDVGRPARKIVATAAEFDTVVIGSHSSTLVDRLFVGNVADTVVKRSPVPVVVVR